MAKAKLNYQKIRSPKKCFINVQNIDDNECLKYCLVRYLYPADHNPDKDFAKELDFKDIMLPVKIKYINKVKKKTVLTLVFLVIKMRKKIQFINQKNNFKKHVDLLLIENEDKLHYILMKNFNRFMYNKTLHHGRKRFFRYCLKYFSSAEILQRHANY